VVITNSYYIFLFGCIVKIFSHREHRDQRGKEKRDEMRCTFLLIYLGVLCGYIPFLLMSFYMLLEPGQALFGLVAIDLHHIKSTPVLHTE
jgi:hypothetical protein